MPTPTVYNYSISIDFGGSINVATLVKEIHQSSIVIDLDNDRIDTDGDTVSIYFKDSLGTDDLATLDTIIASHDSSIVTAVKPVTIANNPEVYTRRPPNKKRVYVFSPNWCDKTTWYERAEKVTDKVIGTGDGVTKSFTIDDQYSIIEIGRGKITDDHIIVAPDGGDYRVVVKVGTATAGYTVLNEREEFESSGGDYVINYSVDSSTNGATIDFAVAPAIGDDILVTYYRCRDDQPGHSVFEFGPPSGKKWVIDHIEAQFTTDVTITDTMIYQAWINHPSYGKIPAPGEPEVRYHTAYNYDDYVTGALPMLSSWGGTGVRGRPLSMHVIQWEYASSVILDGNSGVYMRMWLKHDRQFIGTRATVTIYALEE